MQAVITAGPPGSGKSTWAKEFMAERTAQGEKWHELNRDNVRFGLIRPGGDWKTWKWSDEPKVTAFIDENMKKGAELGYSVVISDTNTNPKYLNHLKDQLHGLGYSVTLKYFDTPYETCVKRDAGRPLGVGAFVIGEHHFRAAEQFGKRYEPDPSKPSAIIVDIDGTVAKMNGRGPFEWHRVGEDLPRTEVIAAVDGVAIAMGADVLMTSGRDAVCRDETIKWLQKQGIWHSAIFMRPQGDMRKDTAVKSEIFWRDIAPHYNVVAAFDDRPVIVRLWHEIGIPNVFAVANPYLEF